VIEKGIAPHQPFGVVGQELDAPLWRNGRRNARDRKTRPIPTTIDRDRPAHIDERQDWKTGRGQAPVLEPSIGGAESGEMEPDMAG